VEDRFRLLPAISAIIFLLFVLGSAVIDFHKKRYGCDSCHPKWLPGNCPAEPNNPVNIEEAEPLIS
jgi:hypothetical protein